MSEFPHLFTAIDHVGVAVADLDEAKRFYERTFGMRLVHEEVNEEQGVREAMMSVGDSGSCVQLLAPLSPGVDDREVPRPQRAGRPAGRLPRGGRRGGQHDAPRARAAAALRRPRRGTAGSRVNFVHPKDAGGVLVELVEPAGHH